MSPENVPLVMGKFIEVKTNGEISQRGRDLKSNSEFGRNHLKVEKETVKSNLQGKAPEKNSKKQTKIHRKQRKTTTKTAKVGTDTTRKSQE